MLVHNSLLRTLSFLAAAYLAVHVVFPEWTQMVLRMVSGNTAASSMRSVVFTLLYAVAFALLSLPVVFGFAAVYRDSGIDLFWLRRFRSTAGIVVVSLAFICLAAYLSFRPVYDQFWSATVRVDERQVYGGRSIDVHVRGSEYFNGMLMQMGGKDTTLSGRTNYLLRTPDTTFAVSWCSVDRKLISPDGSNSHDSTAVLERRILLHSEFRPLEVTVTYRSATPFEASSSWAQGGRRSARMSESDRTRIFTWFSYPDTNLTIPVTLVMGRGQTIKETIEITYDSLAYPVILKKENTNFIKRTFVTAFDTIRVPVVAQNLAEQTR
jgi:hypothetical protein